MLGKVVLCSRKLWRLRLWNHSKGDLYQLLICKHQLPGLPPTTAEGLSFQTGRNLYQEDKSQKQLLLTKLALRPETITPKRVFHCNHTPKSYLARASDVSFVFSGELDWISFFCRATPCLLPALWPPGSAREPDLQSINRMHLLHAMGERPHYCVTVGRCFQSLSEALFYHKVFLLAASWMLSPPPIVSFDMCGTELGDKKLERIVRAKGLDLRIEGQSSRSDKLRKHLFEDLVDSWLSSVHLDRELVWVMVNLKSIVSNTVIYYRTIVPYIFNNLDISFTFFYYFPFLVVICLVDKKQGL